MYSEGLLPLVKKEEAAALPEWVPSLEAGNQLGRGLYLNLVPFVLIAILFYRKAKRPNAQLLILLTINILQVQSIIQSENIDSWLAKNQ